jgi:hypothetical protein
VSESARVAFYTLKTLLLLLASRTTAALLLLSTGIIKNKQTKTLVFSIYHHQCVNIHHD